MKNLESVKELKELRKHLPELKEMLKDIDRNKQCVIENEGVIFDFSHS